MFWPRLVSIFLIALTCLPTVTGTVRSLGQAPSVIELGWEGVVAQSQPNYCGPAVIATLLRQRGIRVTEADVVARARMQRGGVSLAEFSRLAEQFGLRGRWFAVSRGNISLEALSLPAVVHLRGEAGHFAILERELDGFVELVDPARGRLLLSPERFQREWTGRLFLFQNLSVAWSG